MLVSMHPAALKNSFNFMFQSSYEINAIVLQVKIPWSLLSKVGLRKKSNGFECAGEDDCWSIESATAGMDNSDIL